MSALKYSYHEERGEFHGYVEDEMGNVIFEMHYPEFYEDDETGELLESSTIFEDGFMKHADDTEGLRKYLVDMRLINEDDEVIHEDDFKSNYHDGGLTSGAYGHGTTLLEEGGEMDIEEEDKEENEIEEHLQSISDDTGIPVDVLRSYADEIGTDYMDLTNDIPYNGAFGTQEDFAEHLVDNGLITDLSNYLYMTATDIRILAGEEADARLDGMDDEDIADLAGKSDEYEELKEDLERLEELNDEIEVLESDIKEKKDAFDHENATEEERDDFDDDIQSDEEELENAKEQKELLDNKIEWSSIDDFIDDIRDDALSNANDEITEELEKDAVGYFENLGYSQQDLANHSLFSIDYEKLAEDVSYDYIFIEGEDGDYHIFNNYADGGAIPEGYHQMPDGTIMPDSAHLEHGGGVSEGNLHMLKNQAEQFEHHAKELQEALRNNPRVDAWVVAKAERAATDLSDITHYLAGVNNENSNDGEDVIKMDVPLFIRSQEYAREDAKSDADLHEFADNAIDLSQSGETLEMDDYNKLVPNHMADGGETPITWKVAYFETIPTRGGEMMTRLATHENIKGDLQQVIDVVKEKIGRYDYANITDTKGVVSGAKVKKDKSVVKFNRGGVNLGASFDKLKKEILDPSIYSARDLKVGETYEWTIGAEPLKVKYLGLADENKDKKASSSIGKGFLFEWVNDAGRYVELGGMALNQVLRKITGYAKGGRLKEVQRNKFEYKGHLITINKRGDKEYTYQIDYYWWSPVYQSRQKALEEAMQHINEGNLKMGKGGRVLSDVDMFVEIHGYYPESVMALRGDGMGLGIIRNEAHNFELSGKDSQKAEEMGYEFDYDKKGWVEKEEDDDDFAKGGGVIGKDEVFDFWKSLEEDDEYTLMVGDDYNINEMVSRAEDEFGSKVSERKLVSFAKEYSGQYAKGGMVEYVLYGTKVGKKDWQEEVLAVRPYKFEITPELEKVTKKDGYNRLRIAKIDLSTPPDFRKIVKKSTGGEMEGGEYAKGGATKKEKVDNSDLLRYANSGEQLKVLKDIIPVLNKKGIKLTYGTSIGKSPQTIIFDKDYQDNILYISGRGWQGENSYYGEDFNSADDLKYVIENPSDDDDYAKGGKLSSFFSKAKDYTKKQIKDKKRKIALEVIDSTKDKVSNNKQKMLLKSAEQIVEDKYARGGATFDDKVKAISSSLTGKEVPKRLRKDYGKKYNKKEALEAARRIAGSMRAKEMKKGKK